MTLFPWWLELLHTGLVLLLRLETTQNSISYGVARCPGLTRMAREEQLLSAWLCADILVGVSLKARFLELFEGKTLLPFTILVPGGWGMNLSPLALGSDLLLLFERKCFQFYKGLSFILKKKEMIHACTFCKTPKGSIPESLPLWIDYWDSTEIVEWEAETIVADP